MREAYIVAAKRTAVGKAPRGALRFVRPEDMACAVIKSLINETGIPAEEIDDVIVGCAMPEGAQGANMARYIALWSLGTDKVPGMTVNRFCASGLETIAIAFAKIRSGIADCIIAGGTESMSYVPMMGFKPSPHPIIARDFPDWYWGMGLTAEQLAIEKGITREETDEFAYQSHQKAIKYIDSGKWKDEIVPLKVEYKTIKDGKAVKYEYIHEIDEGPRRDTSIEALSKLKPVFKDGGIVTAGNASQRSDGAAFVIVASDNFVKRHNLKPIATLVSYSVVGVPPRIMGIGPAYAIPEALKKANLKIEDITIIELNEAFACQALAVIKETPLPPDKVNVNGGAVALGHPLGCTGAKLTVSAIYETQRRKGKYFLVTMCVGTGQGAAGIFQLV